MVSRPFRRSGSGWESLPEVRKWSEILPEDWKRSEDPPGGPQLVGRYSRRCRTYRDTLPEVRYWSENPPGGL